MKTLLILTLMMTASYGFAQEDMEERCTREADLFGGQNLFTPDCESWMIRNSTFKKVTATYFLHAWRNVSILRFSEGKFIITGENTQLGEILDLFFVSKTKQIFILNQTKETKQILVFDGISQGDVAPLRVISSPEIDKITTIKLHPENENLVVGKSADGKEEFEWETGRDSRVSGDIKPLKKEKDTIFSLVKNFFN